MTPRLPWICSCGVFNSQARDVCRVCKGTRQEAVPSPGLPHVPPEEDGSQELSQLLAAIEETRTYLSTVESDDGVSSALKALEKAANTTSAGTDVFHMLISSAMMVLNIRVNMGCPLEPVVARLRAIEDQK